MKRHSQLLWWVGVALSALLISSCLFLGFYFENQWTKQQDGNEVDFEDDDEAEVEQSYMDEITCFDLGRTFRAYWDCLVEGHPDDPIEHPSLEPAVSRLKKLNVSKSSNETNNIRVKREDKPVILHYQPLDREVVFTFIPVSHDDWYEEEHRQPINDYGKFSKAATSPYLFYFDPKNIDQSHAPWSYHGFLPAKEWHTLTTGKFFPRLVHGLTPREATFRNFYSERMFVLENKRLLCSSEYTKDSTVCQQLIEDLINLGVKPNYTGPKKEWEVYSKRIMLAYLQNDDILYNLFPDDPSKYNIEAKKALDIWPPHFLAIVAYYNYASADPNDTNTDEYQKLFRSLTNESNRGPYTKDTELDFTLRFEENEPSRGYYSSMRFLLPPYITDKELTQLRHEETAAIEKDFVRASRNHLNINRLIIFLKNNAFDPTTNKTINDIMTNRVIKTFQNYTKQTPGQGNLTKEEKMHRVFKELEKERIPSDNALVDRYRYSLPLFPKVFPICSHREPSPININTTRAIDGGIGPFTLGENACRGYRMRVSFPSDGTDVLSLRLEDDQSQLGRAVTLSGGAVRGHELLFDEMHVHIGQGETDGSEHRLNGKGYAMELQLIFQLHGSDTSTPYYYTLARQMNDLFPIRERTVLILAVFVEVKEKPENEFLFEPLAQAASRFRKQNEDGNLDKYEHYRGFVTREPIMTLQDFIPDSVYYTYRGSLTIPPCFPYVIWSVFEKPLQISKAQFEELRLWPTPSSDDTGFLSGNVRRFDDQWVEGENRPGITEEEMKILKYERNNRIVIRSRTEAFTGDYKVDAGTPSTHAILPNFYLFMLFLHVLLHSPLYK